MLVGIDRGDRDRVLAQERHECGAEKTFVPHLHGMSQGSAVEALRQQRQECRKIIRLESLCGRELPENRPELRFQFKQAARQEALDGRAGLGEQAAVGGEARSFE